MGGNEIETETEAMRSIERWESALRARCAIIAQNLLELTSAGRELAAGDWAASTFATASEVSAYVSLAVGRANATYRSDRRYSTAIEALHAVVEAEAAIDAIGRDPAVLAFLAWGTSIEHARFRSACRMLAALLDVSPATASPTFLSVDDRNLATAAGSGRWACHVEPLREGPCDE